MYECVALSKKNINYFRELNRSKYEFNLLNMDFFESYDSCNFAQQILLKRKVKLLKLNHNYIGYIWWQIDDKNICNINSMSVCNKLNNLNSYMEAYSCLIYTLRKYNKITYLCENSNNNFKILNLLGFTKKDGTLILYFNINNDFPLISTNGFEFEVLKKGIDEQKRCVIQNKIFKDDTRIPLTLEDIYFDEIQEYYYEKGAIFLKKDGQYIGYGQIIIEDNTAFIVNFGILREYRGNGYSKFLLNHLLRIIKFNELGDVLIKVKNTNIVALNLYKSLGFKIKSEISNWQISNSV